MQEAERGGGEVGVNSIANRRIADFCDKMSGFADFENTADRELAENSGLFMSLRKSVQIVDTNIDKVRITLVGLRSSLVCWH